MENQHKYTPPQYGADAFNCPYCAAYAHQAWNILGYFDEYADGISVANLDIDDNRNTVHISCCSRCRSGALWVVTHKDNSEIGEMIVPRTTSYPPLPEDVGEMVCKLYKEATDIASLSPRAAIALARAIIEVMCKQVTEKKENGFYPDLKDMIPIVKEKYGLDSTAIDALDALRVTGNNAIHPHTIDLNEVADPDTAFKLIGYIAELLILRDRRAEIHVAELRKKNSDTKAKQKKLTTGEE